MLYQVFPRPPLDLGLIEDALEIDWNLNPIVKFTIGADIALTFGEPPPFDCMLYLEVTQAADDAWELDWDGIGNLVGNPPEIGLEEDETTVIPIFWDGTNYQV